MNYEHKVQKEIDSWEQQMFKSPGWLEKTSKNISNRINLFIPSKVHNMITTTIRSIVRTALFGAEYTPGRPVARALDLEQADQEARERFAQFQKIAVAEGAGTGAGGIMLSMVDFPALIAIKMKFLFELAHVYGYDTKHFAERVFILKVFQMTFAGPNSRAEQLEAIKHWHLEKDQWKSDSEYYKNMDWETFQIEYRDSMDFRKMLQMLPGIGAFAGAWANYTILEELREYAMNAYRLRWLQEQSGL
ncbi:EcsC family protein [Paenibacillus campinasensis]|uniref:ABC transporter-associated protein EcsC n=1 Tax=Paenibacillus campinasensis TaxID=66347 RepID=A0A268EQB5_9BACL|nr:EcsC family protein [Paenibacillus campinasensis]PAD75291.1 ABC transporter-associated protein EcsC [Paenibacillus campinasensis]